MLMLLLLSLCTYRITRFLIVDTLIDTPRIHVHGWLLGKQSRWRSKVYELITCKYCLSIWVAAGLTIGTAQVTAVPTPLLMWIGAAGGGVILWDVAER